MPLELPAMPSFQTNIPQMPSSLDQYGKMLQLKALQGQQAMQPLQQQEAQQQIQASALENQQRELELKSQQAMVKAWSDPDFTKGFTGTDKANASGVGFDPDALTSSLISKGVLPKDAMAMTSQFVDRSAKIADTLKAQGQAGEATAAIRSKTFEALGNKFAAIQDAAKTDLTKGTAALNAFQQDLATNPKAYAGLTQQEMAELHSATTLDHLSAVSGLMGFEGQIADAHKKQLDEASAQYKKTQDDLAAQGKLTDQSKQTILTETNPKVVAAKEDVAKVEAQTRMAMEGIAKPVYAFDPKTQSTKLSNQTEALSQGLQAIRPVTEKDVREDTMLTNRLADVHQKVAEYEQALQKPVSSQDQSNIAALLGTDKLKAGVHPSGLFGGVGLEIPTERIDAALNKKNIEGLSANARDQLIAFRNAREAMLGYKTVLSGSARGSDKGMDLLTQALPDPSTTDPDYSTRSLAAFKQNLHVVGQGLPQLPGIKSPHEIESEVWGGAKKDFFSQFGGQAK